MTSPTYVKQVDKLLAQYQKAFDEMYTRLDGKINEKFYLANIPKTHSLKMSHVNAIKKGKVAKVYVIAPQAYTGVEKLDKKSDEIANDYFNNSEKIATTGSGDDKWILVTEKFVEWLEKHIAKINKTK